MPAARTLEQVSQSRMARSGRLRSKGNRVNIKRQAKPNARTARRPSLQALPRQTMFVLVGNDEGGPPHSKTLPRFVRTPTPGAVRAGKGRLQSGRLASILFPTG